MQYKKTRVGRPREVKGNGKPTMLYLEEGKLNDFKQMCQEKYGISLSEGIRQLVDEELEKNAIGLENPIAVKFRETDSKNSLDYYLDNGFVTRQYWRKELENHPNEKLEKLEAFGLTITETCKQIKHFKTTGKYLA